MHGRVRPKSSKPKTVSYDSWNSALWTQMLVLTWYTAALVIKAEVTTTRIELPLSCSSVSKHCE